MYFIQSISILFLYGKRNGSISVLLLVYYIFLKKCNLLLLSAHDLVALWWCPWLHGNMASLEKRPCRTVHCAFVWERWMSWHHIMGEENHPLTKRCNSRSSHHCGNCRNNGDAHFLLMTDKILLIQSPSNLLGYGSRLPLGQALGMHPSFHYLQWEQQ